MILEICTRAKAVSIELAKLSSETKNKALRQMAEALIANVSNILVANLKDVNAAKARRLKAALLERLALDQRKIETMARSLHEISELPDPVGEVINTWTRPNGLIIAQVRVPLWCRRNNIRISTGCNIRFSRYLPKIRQRCHS